jgi:hypothetical protein
MSYLHTAIAIGACNLVEIRIPKTFLVSFYILGWRRNWKLTENFFVILISTRLRGLVRFFYPLTDNFLELSVEG